MGFSRFVAKRTVNMVIVLFATLVLTIALVGPTMDKIIKEAIRFEVTESTAHNKNLRFNSPIERQEYIDREITRWEKLAGLDQPWYSPPRFANTVLRVMVLDLGQSNTITSENGSPKVQDIILEKLPKTVLLFTTSTIIVTVIGLYIGAFVGNRTGSVWDKITSAFAVFSSSFPFWWVGMLMIIVFAFAWHLLPAQSTPLTRPSDPGYTADLLYHMILPLATIVFVGVGAWAFTVRYFVVGILNEDFISAKRTAGIPEKRIVYTHALRNAAPPIVTVVALSLAGSLSGAITIEAVFGWPGMGSLYYKAIGMNDMPVIIGITYVLTLIFVITVFVTDLLYGYFDPRVKVG